MKVLDRKYHLALKKIARLEKMVYQDPLTSVLNKRKFNEDIKRAFRSKSSCALFLDIDHLKEWNDTHGHASGDKLLKNVAATIKSALRDNDEVYRFGGDEFVVILKSVDKQEAMVAGERILDAFRNTKFTGEEQSQPSKKLTVSIGGAINNISDTHIKWIRNADKSLYKAKEQGRNQMKFS